MRVLITGGAGFIGCNTAKRFLDIGHEVIVLDNLSRLGSELNLKWLKTQKGYFEFIYGAIFGVMSLLRYLSIHNTVVDFGSFDCSLWNIVQRNEFGYLAYGHFSPALLVYALFYKLYSSGMILFIAQTIAICLSALPLYLIARDKLKSSYYALLIVIIYFLYSPLKNSYINDSAYSLIVLCRM